MTVSDPIADMLTRIRNAIMARHDFVLVPSSKMKLAITTILKAEGFISDYEVIKKENHQVIKIALKYDDNSSPVLNGLERVSKPGLRVYTKNKEVPRVYGGLGVAIVSTPEGVMTGQQAWRKGIGGELLCYVY